jgi:hypothetical protein
MLDLLVSKVQVLGCDGSGSHMRAPHDSPGRVCNPELILEPLVNRNWYWLLFESRFDSSCLILILSSWAVKKLFTSNRVRFELPSEATIIPIEVQAVAQMVSRVVIERCRLLATFEDLPGRV